MTMQGQYAPPSPPPTQPKKKRPLWLMLGIGVVGLCAVCGIIGSLANLAPTVATVAPSAFTKPIEAQKAVLTPTEAPIPLTEQSPTQPPLPTDTSVPPPPAKEEAITIKGSGISKTKPFTLAGGNYSISWVAKDKGDQYSVGCFHGGAMQAVDPNIFMSESIGNDMVEAGKSKTGSTEVYNVKAGQYYFDMSSGCDWQVTISPQ